MGTSQKRRVTIAIILMTLALTALFLAQGTTGLLAAALLDLDAAPAEGPNRARRPSKQASASRGRKSPTKILQRNIFDPETGDLTAVRVAEVDSTSDLLDAVEPPDGQLPRCDGPVRLVGSLFNVQAPQWSFAAIADGSGKSMLYRRGGTIDGRQVLAVNPNHVVLNPANGGPCRLAMFDPEQGTAATPTRQATARAEVTRPTPPARPAREGAITSTEMDEAITMVSETQYNVSRGLVDKILGNQAELMRQARIIPHEEGGRTVGVKLYGIRRQSLLGRLGLQNGDMLRTINGYDMTSPDAALEAYARLRSANNLSIAVVRRGTAKNIEYSIQ